MPNAISSKRHESTASVRRTITLSSEVEMQIQGMVGDRKFSAFVQEALAEKLQRERIEGWLKEREAERGGKPLGQEAILFAERAWRNRK